MQEAVSLPLMVLIAALMVAVGGLVVWHFQDAQKVADWGEAYVYPLARPYNATHFWLGAQAAFADVEVGRVAVDGAEYLASARLQYGRQAWLNYSGQPLLARCNSTVAYEVRRGTASRVLAFKAVCPEREASLKMEKHGDWLLPMMVAYGSYVLDYVAFNETAVIAAYFKGDGVYVRNIWDRPVTIAVDPPIGAAYGDLYSAASAARMFVLLPGQEAKIVSMNSLAPVDFNYVTYYPVGRRWVYGIPLVNGSAVELWLNAVPSYRGPASGAEVLSPIGVRAYVQPDGVRLPYWVNTGPPGNEGVTCADGPCYCKKNGGLYFNGECYVQGEHLMPLGASWSGWVEGYNIYFKTWRELFRTRYVFKADPIPYGQLDKTITLYVYPGAVFNTTGSVINATNLGNGTVALREAGSGSAFVGYQLVGPLQVFEVGAVRRPDGLKVFWSEPANPLDVKEAVLKKPGGNVVNVSGAQGAALLYADDKFWIAVADANPDDPLGGVRIVFSSTLGIRTIYDDDSIPRASPRWGDVDCYIRTNGDVDFFYWPLDGASYNWTLRCYRGGQPVTPTYKLELNLGSWRCGLFCTQPRPYSIKVYVDGQLVREVSGRLYWDSKTHRWEMPIFPSYVPVYVWWNGSEVKMWALPRGVWGVNGFLMPKQTNTGAYVRILYLYKITDVASYKYTLRVKAGYTAQQLGYDYITGNYLYEVQASSALWLYLWNKLVGYDAVDGVGYTTVYVGGGSYSPVEEGPSCIPTKIIKEKNHEHRNWEEVPGGYTVDIYKTYEVREFGCGSDVNYTYKEYWTTVKAQGNIYVINDQGKTCTMQQRNIKTDEKTGQVGCRDSQN